MKNIVYKAARL